MGPGGGRQRGVKGATARANLQCLPCLPCKGRAGVPEETMSDPSNPNTNLITRPAWACHGCPACPGGRWVVVARPELVFAVRERSSVVENLACPKPCPAEHWARHSDFNPGVGPGLLTPASQASLLAAACCVPSVARRVEASDHSVRYPLPTPVSGPLCHARRRYL